MKNINFAGKLAFFMGAIAGMLLSGCATQQQYRTEAEPQSYDGPGKPSHAMIETTKNYTLGYVEFDDQGWLYGTNKSVSHFQIDTVVGRIEDEAKTNGLLIVTFVHGWKHNASCDDSNVIVFHGVLDELGRMEKVLSKKQGRKARRVVGVYAGWRGLSQDIPYLENLTFWERKNTAEKVGHGAVIELLSQLERVKKQSNLKFANDITNHQRMNTKLIIVGHSFGGDIVFSAAAPILTERMIENYDDAGNAIAPKTLGDLVVLINPAFEAARFETLQRLATTKEFPPGKNCVLAVFTSTTDDATGVAFPAGRYVSTFLETYEPHTDQHKANITAVGHYAPYLTHDLKVIAEPKSQKTTVVTNDVSTEDSANQVIATRQQIKSSHGTRNATSAREPIKFSHCELIPHADAVPNDPVFNVAVDPKIIPDHNTISQGVFVHFLTEFLFDFSSDDD